MIPGYMDISNGMSEHPAEIVAQETDIFDRNSPTVFAATKFVIFKLNFLCLT